MDCTKFESALFDELYGELDEVTRASLRKHEASCEKCAELAASLRSAKDETHLEKVEVPAGLELAILERAFGAGEGAAILRAADEATRSGLTSETGASAAREASVLRLADAARKEPDHRTPFARFLSTAGSWAMRPSTAMAAVFVLMTGTSVLLLRGHADSPRKESMTITAIGEPAEQVAPAASAAPLSEEELGKAHGAPRTPGAATSPSLAQAGDGLMGGGLRKGAPSDYNNYNPRPTTIGGGFAGASGAARSKKSDSSGDPFVAEGEARAPSAEGKMAALPSKAVAPPPPAPASEASKEYDPCAEVSKKHQAAVEANSEASVINAAAKSLDDCRARQSSVAAKKSAATAKPAGAKPNAQKRAADVFQ